MKRFFALTTVLAIGTQAVWAQDYDKGLAAYQAGDFETAVTVPEALL